MNKLIRVEFIRSPSDGEWMVFEKFENGAQQGSRASKEDILAIVDSMYDDFGTPLMPTDLVKDEDE